MTQELTFALRLAIAGLVGLAVGIEREWSARAPGQRARFAGLRTFFMLGLLGGVAGLFLATGLSVAAAALITGAMLLSAAAYVMSARQAGDADGTTEVAAILVVALGALAGLDHLGLSAGAGAIVVLALNEKQRLHDAVGHLRESELRGALRFAVLALVVLPLLPERTQLGALLLEPRMLWIVVLIFSGLNFAAFVARRIVGKRHGYGIVGMLGGLISSTAISFDFARRSREEPAASDVLAYGVIGACTVLIPRVLTMSVVLNPAVARELLPLLLPAAVIGALLVARSWRGRSADDTAEADAALGNPLRLGMAIRMALIFQVAISAISYFRSHFAATGLYGAAVALGLSDMDALTVGMNRPAEPLAPDIAARAIAIGMLTNTGVKMGIAGIFGSRGFVGRTMLGLAAIGSAIAAMLWLR